MSVMPKKILVAVDGSKDAALATRAAIDISNKTGAQLHVVHAWRRPQAPSLARPSLAYPSQGAISYSDTLQQEAEELLEEQVRLTRDAGGSVVRAHLREGRPADEVAGLAEELEVDLVVVGSRGIGTVERLVTGSVSEGIVYLAPCPVLVMRGGEEAWPPSDIVIGDDSSKEARRAGELAAGLGQLFGASVHLVRTFYPDFHLPPPGFLRRAQGKRNPYAEVNELLATEEIEKVLQRRAEELEKILGRRLQTMVSGGDAAEIVLEVAEESEHSALIAVGSRGLGTVKRGLLGSVSTKILRAASGPVLLVPRFGGPLHC